MTTSPKDLETKIKTIVLSNSSHDFDLEKECKELGKAAAQDIQVLVNLLDQLIVSKNDRVRHFAIGVGLSSICPQQIFDRLKQLIEPSSTETLDLKFINGLIEGWNKVKPKEVAVFLDGAVKDEVLGEFFPTLQSVTSPDPLAYKRLINALEINKSPGWRYVDAVARNFNYLSLIQIDELLSLLIRMPENGLSTAITILHGLIPLPEDKDPKDKIKLQQYCLKFLGQLNWKSINIESSELLSDLIDLIKFFLEIESQTEADAMKIFNKMLQELGEKNYLGEIIEPFLNKYPDQILDIVYRSNKNAIYLFKNSSGFSIIETVQEEVLLNWYKVSPEDRGPFVVHACKIFENSGTNNKEDPSSFIKNFLANFANKKEILKILQTRLSSDVFFGSYTQILRQRLPYFDKLNLNNDEELQMLIEEIKEGFLKEIRSHEQESLSDAWS